MKEAKGSAPSRARIYGILAQEANTIVLLRRGPSRHTLMLTWDLNRDVITPGQWLTGRVHEMHCDVSPNGQYLVALCSNYSRAHVRRHPNQRIPWTWTVICRPPYFTALALWTGPLIHVLAGGVWMSNSHLRLASPNNSSDPEKPVPQSLKVESWADWYMTETPLVEQIMTNKGWKVLSRCFNGPVSMTLVARSKWKSIWRKGPRISCDGVMTRDFKRGTICRIAQTNSTRWELWNSKGIVIRTWRTEDHPSFWMELDDGKFPVFAEGGCLYRWASFPEGEPTLVADLNHYTFTEVPSPDWATRW